MNDKEAILRDEIYLHQADIARLMHKLVIKVTMRAASHDESKHMSPEFEALTSIKDLKYGTPEYFECTKSEGIQHHYKVNRHHPEHFENGASDMNILDIIEYFVDVMAAARRRSGTVPQWESLAKRHGLSEQLVAILRNSEKMFEEGR